MKRQQKNAILVVFILTVAVSCGIANMSPTSTPADPECAWVTATMESMLETEISAYHNSIDKQKHSGNLPEYLIYVWPSPGSQVSSFYIDLLVKDDFSGSIEVGFSYYKILQELGQQTIDSEDRSIGGLSLFVDNELAPNDDSKSRILDEAIITNPDTGEILFRGINQVEKFWFVPLSPGKHHARFIVTSEDGMQSLEYQWEFTIIEQDLPVCK